MANILFINSSARSTGSISRQLTGEFIEQLKAAQPGSSVVERDVAAHPIPHLDECWVPSSLRRNSAVQNKKHW